MSGIKIKPDKDFEKTKRIVDKMPELVNKASARLASDMRTRVPPRVKKEVKKIYTVDNKAFKDNTKIKSNQFTHGDSAGIDLIYSSQRRLTLAHFKWKRVGARLGNRYSDKTLIPGDAIRAGGRSGEFISNVVFMAQPKPYKIMAQIVRGRSVPIPGHAFITEINNKRMVFQRTGSKRFPINAIPTVTVPQMIRSDRAAKAVQLGISFVVTKRSQYQFGRLEKTVSKMVK